MSDSIERATFKNASTTFYVASRLFPRRLRADVFKLYSFVRVADDYVDCVPPKAKKFLLLRRMWELAHADPNFDVTPHAADTVDERVIKNIVFLTRTYDFDPQWITDFLDAMQSDLEGKVYRTLADALWYVHGSAEVVGLMMAKLMDLGPEAAQAAQRQGRAFQWINFVRDLDEDNRLGRTYFPTEDLEQFGLKDLAEETARQNPGAFQKFIHFQLGRYHDWQRDAQKGYVFLPLRARLAIRAAVRRYNRKARRISQNPFVVFE